MKDIGHLILGATLLITPGVIHNGQYLDSLGNLRIAATKEVVGDAYIDSLRNWRRKDTGDIIGTIYRNSHGTWRYVATNKPVSDTR